MSNKKCLICEKTVKAKELCSTHHQRMLRNGTPYLKGEEKPVPLELIRRKWNRPVNRERTKLNLNQYLG